MKDLIDFLEERGWNHEVAKEAHMEYLIGSCVAAKETVSWMNSHAVENDYVIKMEEDISEWEDEMIKEKLPCIMTIKS